MSASTLARVGEWSILIGNVGCWGTYSMQSIHPAQSSTQIARDRRYEMGTRQRHVMDDYVPAQAKGTFASHKPIRMRHLCPLEVNCQATIPHTLPAGTCLELGLGPALPAVSRPTKDISSWNVLPVPPLILLPKLSGSRQAKLRTGESVPLSPSPVPPSGALDHAKGRRVQGGNPPKSDRPTAGCCA